MKPRIAIPLPHGGDPEYALRAIPQYERAVELSGGEPVRIPLDRAPAETMKLIESCDGVLLPGSKADVDPAKFEAPRHPKTEAADSKRDTVDELLLQDAYNMRKPILGICYGMQSLNVWRTGTLDQHLTTGINHEPARTVVEAHQVRIDPISKLAAILQAAGVLPAGGAPAILVNSSHHQAVATLGDGLRLVAWCPNDEVVEAVEGTAADHFVLCVQWHPERTYESDANSRALFQAFVRAAAEWHKKLPFKQQDFESLPGKR